MRISWFVAIEAFLLSIVFAKTEDPNRLEDLTIQEPVSPANVNSSAEEDFATNLQQTPDPEKTRNVRHIPSVSSPIFAENHWHSIESPIFFESLLQDKEKTKLVLIEPFFRAKKEEKGFWGWLKKIFGNNNKDKDKIGQGPLIGPVKVPGMGDNVYIRAADKENDADHVVIHLMMKNPPAKEIKFESHLPLVHFDAVHELPGESSSFQTIVSPHFSHEGLFDKSHFPGVVDASWSSVPSSMHFPSVKENFYANPSFFRKHSTVNEGSEFPGALPKDVEHWPQQQVGLPAESYGQGGQLNFYEAEDNRQFSSAREDISNIQRTQTSGLEIAENKEPLPLYPPLFNGSFGQNNSNNRNQVYVTTKKSSSGPKRESQPYPGLGAYKSELKIDTLPKNVTIEEEYISNAGIQEVEAPNLSQAENRGIYQFSEIDNDEKSGDNSRIENSKRIRNSHSSDYGNYGLADSDDSKTISDSISKSNETDEALKTISASYPWEYRASKDKVDISKPEEDKIKIPESSDSDSQSLSKSKHLSEDAGKTTVRNEARFRNRIRARNRGLEIKNKKPTNQTEKHPEFRENKSNTLEDKKIAEIVDVREKDEVENPLTAEKVKEFFLKESKRFEEVLKTIEEESEAIKEETRKVTEVKEQNYENDSHGDIKEELKITPESKDDKKQLKIEEKETKSNEEKSKEPEELKINKKDTKESEKLKNTKKERKSIKEIPRNVKQEPKKTEDNSKAIEENSKAIEKELNTLREDLKAVKEELKVSREKAKSKPTEETLKLDTESKPIQDKPEGEESKLIKEIPNNHEEKVKPTRKLLKLTEDKTKSTKKEVTDEVKLKPSEDIPPKKLFNQREKSQEKLSTEIKTPEENEKSNKKLEVTTPESRIANKSRSRKPIKEMKKSNSTNRFELKKPKFSIVDGRFKSKLQNSTNFVKSNSTVKIESSIVTTPPSHITRIYAKNRSAEKLKYKMKKEKIAESEENKKTDESKEASVKIEKPKIRISKFSPRIRNFKPKNDTKIAVTSGEVKS